MLRKLSPTVKGFHLCRKNSFTKISLVSSQKPRGGSAELPLTNQDDTGMQSQAKHSRKNIKQMKQDCSKMKTDNVHSRTLTHKSTNYIYVSLTAVKLQIHHNNAFR